MTPTLGSLIDKSPNGEIQFLELQDRCEKFWQIHRESFDPTDLSVEDQKTYELCSFEMEGYWDVIGVGCSWYCGGGIDTLSGTSSLKSNAGITYSPKNVHDLNYKTAWIEGVPGYGIGESVTYHFPAISPRITEIIIVNGYVKSEQAWKENSRVQKLKMYLNDEPYAIFDLADSREEQNFKVEPLGIGDRDDRAALEKKPWWTIRFEILEVYKGDKYEDTAITEIYFDGIDVH